MVFGVMQVDLDKLEGQFDAEENEEGAGDR